MRTSQPPPATTFEGFTQLTKRSAAKQPLLHTAGQTTLELGGLNWPNMLKDLKTFLHINKKPGVLGDFNAVLHKEDRRAGNASQDYEIREMADLMEYGNEIEWGLPFMDKQNNLEALINIHWYEIFDFTQNQYLTNELSDHTPMRIQFPTSPKPKVKFQFCEMWSKHPGLNKIVDSTIPLLLANPLNQLRTTMIKLKALLRKLHREKYAD
ncbi:hypothetical protein Cgig2_008802 [Carnegiea gigantea]|uniref:Endonuclease/exonuclease/phosphatase domain-containing protein n=1 Tax=Carnegiea gigantea TaxID=171969 RepID=A0A9Q1JLP5_9CARY|nr:hypothetical protein Cgig2_008802 [Carnegiea gigantea]